MDKNEISGYRWEGAELIPFHGYLLPALLEKLDRAEIEFMGSKRIFELGCGNGNIANILAHKRWDVFGKVTDIHLRRVGRIPPLAKSMIAIVTKP